MSVLDVSHLQIGFAGTPEFAAVKDLSFTLKAGETLAIVGESGSGKSLTALALMGLLPKTAILRGDAAFADGDQKRILQELNGTTWQDVRGRVVSMVFQEPMSALNPVMQVGKQLSEAISAHQRVSHDKARQIAIEWLGKVQLPEPEKIYARFPHQLSGGQKQRVMIAMAMCHHPQILIADEPTTALDATVQQEVILLMQQLQREHETSMIFITHDLSLAARIASEVLVMYKGQVMEYGAAEVVLKHPQHPYTQALLACRPSVNHKSERLPVVSDFWQPENELLTSESELKNIPAAKRENSQSNKSILKVENVRIWFPQKKNWLRNALEYFKAVDDVSFELYKGETLGLVGESGCGKSTLSRGIMGLVPIHDGHIYFDGKDLAKASQQEWLTARRKMQMIFQDPFSSLNPRLTVGDIVSEPMRVHRIVSRSELKKETLRVFDLVQLPASAYDRYPHQFSGGQRQRIGIARALGLKPEVLICDESVSALDVSIQAQILNLLRDLQQELALTYLFISHDLSVVYYLCDRIMVMQKGKIVETGTAEAVLKHPTNPYTQRLVDAV
ncbi:ABC transporter ATP-binding protein [Taibaiella soli]|uniref:ABC transporter ATP-binding protein n=1 Tax=Taibaiella soli TaxID=1649169 RepID=A0A2W2BFJ8_9BACT|nr:ABC transporter ATP-binding protein [Taibaiella soli]PZF75009.1 ABC transporter ATP-binding protein [Taibaiella soli]